LKTRYLLIDTLHNNYNGDDNDRNYHDNN